MALDIHGYEGGRWDNGHFFYIREVNNVNVTVIHKVYNTRITNINETRVSYNGGQGGINARPTSQEAATRERHIPPVAAQNEHIQAARGNQELRASANHGRPPIAATPKAADFRTDVKPATSAAHYNPPPRGANNTPAASNARNTAIPNELPPHEVSAISTPGPDGEWYPWTPRQGLRVLLARFLNVVTASLLDSFRGTTSPQTLNGAYP